MKYLAVGTMCLLIALSTAAEVSARNCSSEQKQKANDILMSIHAAETRKKELFSIHAPFGIHQSTGNTEGEQVLVQGGYIMGHDLDLRTSIWVSYRLTRKDIEDAANKPRINCFRKDPRFGRGQGASTSDYREPVYDQGHLANDADLKDDLLQQINSYVMSNMSPQECRFNRGIWLSLEHLTRIWAQVYGEIYVTSGAIFDRDGSPGRDSDADAMRMKSNNGKMRVAVPSHFYKLILRNEGGILKAISFLLKHNNESNGVSWEETGRVVQNRISSIQEIERYASLRLHPGLQRQIISEDKSAWDFSNGMPNFEASCK